MTITNEEINAAFKRRYMIHVCADGTVTYRDTVTKEKVFNGRALPVFSVDTIEEAKAIQIRFCRLQYGSHPLMPGRSWYVLSTFTGQVEDLNRVRSDFMKYHKLHQERLATEERERAEATARTLARTPRRKKARKTCA